MKHSSSHVIIHSSLCGSPRDLCASALKRLNRYTQIKVAVLLLLAVSTNAQSFKLEGGWQFLADKTDKLQLDEARRATNWRAARVGLSWNAQFADLRDYMGVAWYRTNFDVPQFAMK